MKVVITTDCFLPRWDGISRFLQLLLPKLAKDMEVTVFAPAFPGEFPFFENVRIIRFPLVRWQVGDIYFSKPDKRLMKDAIKEADVVFNQTLGPIGLAGIKLGKRLKKPVVSYVHNVEWELAQRAVKRWSNVAWFLARHLARRMYNKCSLLLVPSKEIDDLLVENKVKTKKELVSLGVSVKVFSPPKSKAAAKKKVGVPSNKVVIGFCGRIAREKDLPTLYEAFKIVHKKHRNTVLLIVGEGLEDEIPASKSVLRVGKQDKVVPFLRAMDVFVLPSLTETSSLATMEAMAVGLPVIATPVGSISKYVIHKENGLLFARKDVGELVSYLEFLVKNKKERVRLGSAARRTMVRRFSWAKTAERIKKMLMLSG